MFKNKLIPIVLLLILLPFIAYSANKAQSSKIQQIATGYQVSCVLFDSGKAKCWGNNHFGQLGYGHTNNIGDNELPSKAETISLGKKVKSIYTHGFHNCALLEDGNVRCWGNNCCNQLGHLKRPSIGDNELPTSERNIQRFGKINQVEMNTISTCLLIDSSRIICWGSEDRFIFHGWGSVIEETKKSLYKVKGSSNKLHTNPVIDLKFKDKIKQISIGGDHSCLLLDSGKIRCWGSNRDGQLGYPNQTEIDLVEGLKVLKDISVGGKVLQISTGTSHTCALLEDGIVRCWGYGASGVLGSPYPENIGDDEAPSSIKEVPIGGKVIQITSGAYHNCALLETGGVRCWGDNSSGQLGYGHTRNVGVHETPASAGDIKLGGRAIQISSSINHNCALLKNGQIRCWGNNDSGQLGYGHTNNIGDNETPESAGPVKIRNDGAK